MVCVAVWVLVLSGSLPTGFLLDSTSQENSTTNATFCFENFSSKQWKAHLSKVVIFIETVGFIIPLLLNVCCSIMVLHTLRRPQTISRGGKLNKTKILRMILVHLFIFCFCFIPYNVNLVFYALVRTNTLTGCSAESVVRTIYPIALCIAVSNCCFDPIVYYFTSETIQNSFKRKSQVSRTYDAKFSEALQSETSSNLQCSLRTLKAKVFHVQTVRSNICSAINRDLTNRDLTNRDLTNRDLTNRDLTNRDLTNRDLTICAFSGKTELSWVGVESGSSNNAGKKKKKITCSKADLHVPLSQAPGETAPVLTLWP
ncbi:hypothetical protein FQN60_004854 [Etheostoma spectabile]|uniref:G-protein coupled receptors family 1 profile domain-containing protein n=1 Tax=Etheostoma spectabile TaxID=54343 RepID=A0A5J5DLE0_9PERO|nr:hypothetical protein FQN60_004854 [Etheostoma spectabile]